MKLNRKLLLVVLSLSGVSLANAVDRVFGNGAGELPQFLAVYDVDDDGKLNEEERQAARDARKVKRDDKRADWDINEDGELSEEERDAARAAVHQAIEEKRCERFDEIDTDDSGSLSLAEFSAIPALADADEARIAALFARLSGDDDEVSKEEFLAALETRHPRPDAYRPPLRPGLRHPGGQEDGGGEAGDSDPQPSAESVVE